MMIGVQEPQRVTEGDFEAFLAMLDELYDATLTDRLRWAATMDRRRLLGWLKDIASTTDELINELEAAPRYQIDSEE
jgi:hypothetical protein